MKRPILELGLVVLELERKTTEPMMRKRLELGLELGQMTIETSLKSSLA